MAFGVANGDGGGTSTDRFGEGSGGFLFVFEFSFVLLLALISGLPTSTGLAEAVGDAATFALAFAGVVEPPEGRPASDSPVGGLAGSTGLLLGSAARADGSAVGFVGCEFRVNA